jgi:FtsP/CotA-like multicopper oxidase with cupredoxin domain
MPHVFMPIQNPGDSTGQNPYGRWQYGPWFWPPTAGITYPPMANPYYDPTCDADVNPPCEPKLMPATPNVSMGTESYNDTPTVNGTVYPTTTVQPKAYRFRVLNAADDRYFNLQLYKADSSGTEVALDAAAVKAAQSDPTIVPAPDLKKSPAGPNFIQIGTESGFLPAPVIVPNQPITWVTDVGRFDAGNVDKHALLVGPAERADVIVDFSKYAGQTLILYNDAPAAFPARDPRYDYYTGDADLTSSGGAPTTLPGYGPNIRTVMQIKVAAAPIALPFNYQRLVTAFAHHSDGSGVFEASQHPIVVGQGAYNSALGTVFRSAAPNDGFVRINDSSLTFKSLITNPAGGYFGGRPADATTGRPADPSLTIPLQFKAMHDEQGAAFDPVYGRMSGSLGLEDPAALANAQNIYLYPYINPATEIFKGIELPPGVSVTPISSAADGTQIWKITHNGVDTHTMHWHLYDVQVLNRTGWDGIIRAPDRTELGWKETVRVSPLEDTFIAMRPIIPKLPFGVPNSVRLLDPTMPAGSTVGFNQAGIGGTTLNIVNTKVNMGWEYVWHCHLLSHEEMDMMRPVEVMVDTTLPDAPVLSQVGTSTAFNWTDRTPVGTTLAAADNWGNLKNEIGFRLERATVTKGVTGSYTVVGTTLANKTGLTDTTTTDGVTYSYRAVAYNASGDSRSNSITVTLGFKTLSGKVTAGGPALAGAVVTAYNSAGGSVASVTTNSTGDYSMALLAGSYKLYVTPNKTGYAPQWFGGTNQGNATLVDVTANRTQNIPLIGSFALVGKVTTNGGPLAGGALVGAKINIYNAATGASLTSVTSTNGGNYSVNLLAGTYKLYIQPNRNGYPNQWFGGTSFGTATIITVTAGTTQDIIVHT